MRSRGKTEAFPGSPAPTPANRVTGTGPKNQATAEKATDGTWTEGSLKNGVYTYRFKQSLKGISDIPYDPNLIHRVGLEIRTSPNITPTNIPANNADLHLDAGDGQCRGVQSGREIVDNDTCNACHDSLSVHGERALRPAVLRDVPRVVLVRRAVGQQHRPEGDDPQDPLGRDAAERRERPEQSEGQRVLRHLRLRQHVHRLQRRRLSAGQAQLPDLP